MKPYDYLLQGGTYAAIGAALGWYRGGPIGAFVGAGSTVLLFAGGVAMAIIEIEGNDIMFNGRKPIGSKKYPLDTFWQDSNGNIYQWDGQEGHNLTVKNGYYKYLIDQHEGIVKQ